MQGQPEPQADVVVDGRTVTLTTSTVAVDGVVLGLAPRERDLLAALLARPGAVVAKEQILRAVWGSGSDAHAVEVAVGRLRRRLAPHLDIVTVTRRGYRLTVSA